MRLIRRHCERTTLFALALLAPQAGRAAEVVWPAPADAALALQVDAIAGATRGPLQPVDLRGAAAAWSAADDAAIDTLEATLRDVRAYETQLDGELIIMADLGPAISAITLLRDGEDRSRLYSALAYQGFAVDRYFSDDLGTDDRAAPFRVNLNEQPVELPWVDAIALEPTREITPYEIAEAPQRVAFTEVQQSVEAALPARVVPVGIPADAQLVIDGREVTVDRTGTVTLPPGRHLAHILWKDHIVARYDLRLAPAERRELSLAVDDAAWSAWLAAFQAGDAPPDALPAGVAEAITALGGEVWLARAADSRKVEVWKVTPSGATSDTVKLDVATPTNKDSAALMGSAWVDVGWGWVTSGDFYAQDPANVERTVGSVNGTGPGFGLGADLDWMGILRLGLAVSVLAPTGADHVAFTGDGSMRLRPYPHVRLGLTYVQLTAGYVFPYHLGLGGVATVPLTSGLELHAGGLWGPAPELTRDDGSTWSGHALGAAWGGLGWRFGG